ncbi:MAG TPA: DUF3108 domain-containing protein [Candidatus Cybelea sp.]|nr:DUF3108 domain-containing protein [Candidatus Cybelea sp.]
MPQNRPLQPPKRLAAAAAALVLSACGVLGANALARFPQASAHRARAKTTAARKEVAMPFRVGERLEYQISWASFATAATVELTVPERRNLYAWSTWHFRASAHTVNPVRRLFSIDDEFDSYTDATTLDTRQYEMYLNEMGRKVDQVWRFVPEGQSPRAPGPAVIVMPGTRDPLGTLYSLRSVDWQRTTQISAPVDDGNQLYQMRAIREAAGESVEVPAGKFSTTRIGVHVYQHNTEVSGISFAVWIAGDRARTPVVMRADLPFGTLRLELTSAPQ